MVTRSEDDRIAIRQIALTEKAYLLRCLFVFRPEHHRADELVRALPDAGMWDVLRATGHDTLTWTPAPRVADGSRSTLSRLVVNFDFPPEAGDDVFVRDRDNRELKRLTGPDGCLRYRWEADLPRPERYEWDLWWGPLPGPLSVRRRVSRPRRRRRQSRPIAAVPRNSILLRHQGDHTVPATANTFEGCHANFQNSAITRRCRAGT
jgi:hypothetical protein